jgi:predicted HicB family RNase H-like nuclease
MALRAKKMTTQSASKEAVVKEVTKVETTRLNADIPIRLHRDLKMLAAQQGKSITDITIQALNEHLSNYSNE